MWLPDFVEVPGETVMIRCSRRLHSKTTPMGRPDRGLAVGNTCAYIRRRGRFDRGYP